MKNLIHKKIAELILLVIAITLSGNQLYGQKNKFYFKPNYTLIKFNPSSSVDIAGTSFKDLFALADSETYGLSIGYFFSDNISVDLVVGIPPSTNITGEAQVEGLPIGSIMYAPLILSLEHSVFRIGSFRPFVGAGINYSLILSETDGGVEELQVDNFLAPVIKVGFDLQLFDRLGVGFNFLRILNATTSVNGKVGSSVPELSGAPVSSTVDLDPTVFQFGINLIF